VKAETAGTATITVTADGGETATVNVTVTPPAPVRVTGVSISPATVPDLVKGSTFTLTANVTPAGASTPTVTWSTDDDRIVTVSADDVMTAVVTAVAEGSTTITVITDDGGHTDEVIVTVVPPALTAVLTSTDPVPSTGGTREISVESNVGWTAAVSDNWLELSNTSGTAGSDVTITVKPNTDPVDRSATVTFTYGEAQTAEVAVSQEKNPIQATACTECLWSGSTWVNGYVTDSIVTPAGALSWDGTGWDAWIAHGATSDKDGRANTAKIDAQAGSAVQYCKDLGAGWYLPAYEELFNISVGVPRWNDFVDARPLNNRSGAGLLNLALSGAVYSSTEYKGSVGRFLTTTGSNTNYPYPAHPAATAIAVTTHGEMYNEYKNNHAFVCVWRPVE
jgi:hypothetical protein